MQNSSTGNDREFLGITQNECSFQGKVVGKPVVQGDNYAFVMLKTSVSEMSANGQWSDTVMQIPFITMDTQKVGVISKYVDDGRELLIHSYYKPWMQDGVAQHAFIIKKLTLGRKKWEPKSNAMATPPLPQ